MAATEARLTAMQSQLETHHMTVTETVAFIEVRLSAMESKIDTLLEHIQNPKSTAVQAASWPQVETGFSFMHNEFTPHRFTIATPPVLIYEHLEPLDVTDGDAAAGDSVARAMKIFGIPCHLQDSIQESQASETQHSANPQSLESIPAVDGGSETGDKGKVSDTLAAMTERFGSPVHNCGAPPHPLSLLDVLTKFGCPSSVGDDTADSALPPDVTLLAETIPKSESAMGGATFKRFKRPLGGPNSPLRPGNPGYTEEQPDHIPDECQFWLSEIRLILDEIPPRRMFSIPKPGRLLAKAILRGDIFQECRPFARLVIYDSIVGGALESLHDWCL